MPDQCLGSENRSRVAGAGGLEMPRDESCLIGQEAFDPGLGGLGRWLLDVLCF